MSFEDIPGWESNETLDKDVVRFNLVILGCPTEAAWEILFTNDFDKFYTSTNENVGSTEEISVATASKQVPSSVDNDLPEIMPYEERTVLITPYIGLFGELAGFYKKVTGHDAISYTTLQHKHHGTRPDLKAKQTEFWMDFINTPSNLMGLATVNNWGTISVRPLTAIEYETTFPSGVEDEEKVPHDLCCLMKTTLHTASDFGRMGRFFGAREKFIEKMKVGTKEVFTKMLDSLSIYYEEYYSQSKKFLDTIE